jgi:hypothetical protein
LRGQKAAHHEYVFRVEQAPDLNGFLERRHREPCGAALEGCVRHWHRSVAVAVRLDHGEKLGAFGQVAEDAVAVGADRAQVDLRPAKRGGAQDPP